MNRLRDVPYFGWIDLTSTNEVTHEQPCVVILCLSIQSNDLCSIFEVRNGIVVATRYFTSQRIDPQPTAFGVGYNLFLIRFSSFLVSKARALIATGVRCVDS
jgi:hypothetical protein